MRDEAAGDFDYESISGRYAPQRRADPRIGAFIDAALGDARTVLNIGAGAGSYEPLDRHVIAIEPSRAMRAQRPPHAVPAIDGIAEALPLDDACVDASMALVTVHQWKDYRKGLREMCRVTSGPVVVLTFDRHAFENFWVVSYVPELVVVDADRFPSIDAICAALSEADRIVEIVTVPIPLDCSDGIVEAYYGRPEALLDPAVRVAQSAWGFVDRSVVERFVAALRDDLESGVWDARHGRLRTQATFDGSLRLLIARTR